MAAIELQGVTKRWGSTVGVGNVSFNVDSGSFAILLGPSGCGKSTTLRMIAGLEEATSGRLIIGGSDVTDAPPSERALSMVFQSYALFPHLSVRENIVFGLKVRKVSAGEREQQSMAIILVEQYFDFAFGLADQIFAMTRGEVVYASRIADVDKARLRQSVGV